MRNFPRDKKKDKKIPSYSVSTFLKTLMGAQDQFMFILVDKYEPY